MLEIFPDFTVAGARLETSLKCWSLQENAGDLATMLSKWAKYLNSACYYTFCIYKKVVDEKIVIENRNCLKSSESLVLYVLRVRKVNK